MIGLMRRAGSVNSLICQRTGFLLAVNLPPFHQYIGVMVVFFWLQIIGKQLGRLALITLHVCARRCANSHTKAMHA